MRLMFTANTKWESGTYIYETDKVEFFNDNNEIRFIFNNGFVDLLCKIVMKDKKELEDIKEKLFITGIFDFSVDKTYIKRMDGKDCDWICVNLEKEEENGHSK